MYFDARLFKACWSRSRRAASSDLQRPGLTVSKVDVFTAGLRILTTDSYMLCNTFIPAQDFSLDDWPDDKTDAPLSIQVADHRNLVNAILGGVQKGDVTEVTVDESGLTVRAMTAGYPKLTIESYDGATFPAWTGFFHRGTADAAWDGKIGFNADYLAKAATIVGSEGLRGLVLHPVDHLKPVLFARKGSHHRLVLMPVRISSENAP